MEVIEGCIEVTVSMLPVNDEVISCDFEARLS